MGGDARFRISYGKAQVPFYRVYATPLSGVRPIPESAFTGRQNALFAAEVDVEVFGDNFLPAYVSGDNSMVVATDSMKNFVFQQALDYQGATLEGFLDVLGRGFLDTYPQMEALRVTGRELPFTAAPVPGADGGFSESDVLFQRGHSDHALAVFEFARDGGAVMVTGHRCGLVGMELLKVTGSAFTHFVRDEFTTLPERVDRPLFITLDVSWKYDDLDDLLDVASGRYIAPEQLRDLVRVVFHEFVSESIQHLAHEMAQRALARFPQLAEIGFAGQNHTPDPMVVSPTDEKIKVYSSAFPAYGLIKLTVRRDA